jgi:hypothetical protein
MSLGPLPEFSLGAFSIKMLQGLSIELSPKIKDSIPVVIQTVPGILDSENRGAPFAVSSR